VDKNRGLTRQPIESSIETALTMWMISTGAVMSAEAELFFEAEGKRPVSPALFHPLLMPKL
jgi:hypothetical protein